ncbi:MAG TPA: alpha/beta hydrolase [Acidimicrobiales bacterium]|nr:alpha/beta hydrolase [Acidimicrobiales bacterium]
MTGRARGGQLGSRRAGRGVGATAVALVLVAEALAVVGGPLPAGAAASGLAWRPCATRFRCATLRVPLSYAHPDGATIGLSVVMLPATRHAAGDVVLNPGGPGGSGVAFLEQAWRAFPAALRSSFNLVSFDPRGVGRSDPVRCVGPAGTRALLRVDPAPVTARQVRALVAATKSFVAACRAHTPAALLENVSSLDTARDLDRLRAALGQARLNYLGFSYGTYLGELYASLFPSRVRALVLDGVVDPALSTVAGDLQQARGFESELAHFFSWCDATPSCRRELPGGAAAAYGAVFARLVAGHALVAHLRPAFGGTQPVTYGVAVVGAVAALYSESTWPDLAAALASARAGDGDLFAALAFSYAGAEPDGQFTNELAAETAISCVDRPAPRTLAAYEALAARLARLAPHFGAAEAWGTLPCAYWPVRPSGVVGPIRAPGTPTILVVGTTGDPATPYAAARAVAHELAHAVLLTRVGEGHTAYLGSTCVQRYVDRYLATGIAPRPGTTCRG